MLRFTLQPPYAGCIWLNTVQVPKYQLVFAVNVSTLCSPSSAARSSHVKKCCFLNEVREKPIGMMDSHHSPHSRFLGYLNPPYLFTTSCVRCGKRPIRLDYSNAAPLGHAHLCSEPKMLHSTSQIEKKKALEEYNSMIT